MNRYDVTRKGLVVGIILSLLIPCVIPSIGQHSGKKTIQSSSQVDILYVGGGGSGNYTRIQDAINDSITGGTVYVYNDSSPYYEHLVIQKSIVLIGEDKYSTEINGSLLNNSLDTINIIGDFVTIRDFRLTNNQGYYYQAAVKITGDHFMISDCFIHSNEYVGISLIGASFCQLVDCELYDNFIAMYFLRSSGNTIQNCSCHDNADGITLFQSSDDNHLIDCVCERNSFDNIIIQQSSGNEIIGCVCSNGYDGIALPYAPNTKMRNNTMVNNYANFGIGAPFVSDLYCDIDTSNTINGKPMYYLIGENDRVFDESMEIGFLGLVDCQNISVKNLHFTNNFEGMLLAGTVHSYVENCSFTNNDGHGMYLISTEENTVNNCTFRNGYFDGILLYDSCNNTVENCSSYGSYAGVRLDGSLNNTILRQRIDDCTIGFLFDTAGHNTVKESEMFLCGLHVIGNNPAEYMNDVDTTNLVNGRPVYYSVDTDNQVIPPDAGQVILVSSDNCTISAQNLSDASVGIELAYSSLNTIENNLLSRNSVAAIDFDGLNNNMNMIRDNIIQGNNYGIDVDASMSNTIQQNVLSENGLAISIGSSLETLLLRNTIQNSSAGIYFDHSFSNRLSENTIHNASNFGLYFLSSNGNDLEKNHLENCGLLVYGDTPAEYYNDVDTSNTVNGKPIYYLIDQVGFTVPQDAGAVIFVNSSRCNISNLDLNFGTVGVTLAYSSYNIIRENIIADQSWTGIDLSSGSNNYNTIQGNIIQRNSFGLDIEYCTGNTLKHNIITSNDYGVLLYNTVDTIIRRNSIVRNSLGIDVVQTTNSTIRWNNIFLNGLYGLSVDGCSVSALWNWWGSVKGPMVDDAGNGDRLNTIHDGQIIFAPWHRLPVLFSGFLRFILTIIQEKYTLHRPVAIPADPSYGPNHNSPVSDLHGMKNGRSYQEHLERSLRYGEQNFDS